MTLTSRGQLRKDVMAAEGFRRFPYLDCCGKPFRQCQCSRQGKLTIGYGRNLEDVGLSALEGEVLLDHDLATAESAAKASFDWFADLPDGRQRVVVEMIFNLGAQRFRGFGQTIAAIKAGNYARAASQMLASRWAAQVGARAERLAALMRDGG